jgi:transcription elongation factor Elf1
MKCPICNSELPDYFNVGIGVISITVRCSTCNASIGLSKLQPKPHTVFYDEAEDPRKIEVKEEQK